MATPARPVTSTSFPTPAAAAPAAATAPAAPQHFLQRIKLFSGLSVDECQEVVKRMKRRDFPPNHIIVREGQPGTSMFFITSGGVEVRKKDANTGIDFLLTELGPGQNFGEMSLLTGKPRTATVSTNQPSTCAVLEQADFHELLMHYPKIGLALTSILAERHSPCQRSSSAHRSSGTPLSGSASKTTARAPSHVAAASRYSAEPLIRSR